MNKCDKSNDINISTLKNNKVYNSEKNNSALYQRRLLRITVGYQYTSLFTLGKHTMHRPLKWWFYISELSTEVKIKVSKTSITKRITIHQYCKKLHNRLIWSFSFLAYSHISPHISERLYIYIYLLHNSWTVFELHHSRPNLFFILANYFWQAHPYCFMKIKFSHFYCS